VREILVFFRLLSAFFPSLVISAVITFFVYHILKHFIKIKMFLGLVCFIIFVIVWLAILVLPSVYIRQGSF